MTKLEQRFASLVEAQSQEDLVKAIQEFANAHGFAYGSLLYVADEIGIKPDAQRIEPVGEGFYSGRMHEKKSFVNLAIIDEEYFTTYAAELSGKPDPVMATMKTSSVPIVWSQSFYEQHDAGELWEMMSPYGMRNGVITALHLPNNEHVVVGFDGPDVLPKSPAAITSLLSELQLWGTFSINPCRTILLEPNAVAPQKEPVELSLRELEVLRWSAEGKTASEIAQILGVSDSTASKHLSSVIAKLGCINIRSAVVKALRTKIIT